MHERRRQFRAGAAERMPECDGASVDVETLGIDRQLAETGEHLRGKRLVQLDEIDLIQRQPRDLQHLSNRWNRADAESLRLDARGRERNEARERLQAALLRERCGGDENG